MVELTFVKGLILIKQAHQKNVISVTISISQIIVSNFSQMSAIDAIIY